VTLVSVFGEVEGTDDNEKNANRRDDSNSPEESSWDDISSRNTTDGQDNCRSVGFASSVNDGELELINFNSASIVGRNVVNWVASRYSVGNTIDRNVAKSSDALSQDLKFCRTSRFQPDHQLRYHLRDDQQLANSK